MAREQRATKVNELFNRNAAATLEMTAQDQIDDLWCKDVQAEALGASLSTSAGADSLVVSMTVMPAKLDAALSLMADVLRRPLLQAAELDRARAQAMDGLRVSLSEPSALASRVARKLWWGSGPHAAVTTPASLQRISRDDLSSFHRRWARPDRAALVLAGDIEPAAARRLADRWLGDWVAPAEPAPELPAVAPAPLAPALVLIDLPGAGQSAVVLVAPVATGLTVLQVPHLPGPSAANAT